MAVRSSCRRGGRSQFPGHGRRSGPQLPMERARGAAGGGTESWTCGSSDPGGRRPATTVPGGGAGRTAPICAPTMLATARTAETADGPVHHVVRARRRGRRPPPVAARPALRRWAAPGPGQSAGWRLLRRGPPDLPVGFGVAGVTGLVGLRDDQGVFQAAGCGSAWPQGAGRGDQRVRGSACGRVRDRGRRWRAGGRRYIGLRGQPDGADPGWIRSGSPSPSSRPASVVGRTRPGSVQRPRPGGPPRATR